MKSASWHPAAARPGRWPAPRRGDRYGDGEAGRRLGEGAVAAAVAAQHGEGDEDLGGVGDPGPVGPVPHLAGGDGELLVRRVPHAQASPSINQRTSPAWTRAAGRSSPAEGGPPLPLGLTGDGEHGQAGPADRPERQRQARVGIAPAGVGGGDHQLVGCGVQGGRAREERGGVAVGPQTQVHQVETGTGQHLGHHRWYAAAQACGSPSVGMGVKVQPTLSTRLSRTNR